MAMQVEFINGIPTHVLSLRNDDKCSLNSPTTNNSLLLIVPGSPGMGHFYIPFATKLFQLGEGTYEVAVVSHAGHSPGHVKPASTEQDGYESQAEIYSSAKDWYSLEDQIAQKMAFLQKHDKKDSLYLVGHSIGCWMILQMLRQLDPFRVKKVVLLFPTVERMSATPNGQRLASLFTTWRTPFTGLVWLLSCVPDWLRRYILSWYFHTTPGDHLQHVTQATLNIDSKSMHNILCMADQEMKVVVEPPLDVIDQNIDKIVFYYGSEDKWTLASCYEDMKSRHPDKDINLCTYGYPHAFVEYASIEMAEFVFSRLSC